MPDEHDDGSLRGTPLKRGEFFKLEADRRQRLCARHNTAYIGYTSNSGPVGLALLEAAVAFLKAAATV